MQVVHQLLDHSRPAETGSLPVDVNHNLLQAFSILQHELRARSIRLDTELANDLPVLLADPNQLQSVWINLLANAMDAVQNGQGAIR
jgi:histidine kinase